MSLLRERFGWTAVASFVLVAALSGCISDDGSDESPEDARSNASAHPPQPAEELTAGGPQFRDKSYAETEYAAAVEKLSKSLPPGTTFDDTLGDDLDPNGSYEDGYGHLVAALRWQCGWVREYLEADERGDGVARNAAIDALAKWDDLPTVKPLFEPDSGDEWEHTVIEPARKGDDAALVSIGAQC